MLDWLKIIRVCLSCVGLLISFSSFSLEFPLPTSGDDVVGKLEHVITSSGNSLQQLGSVYDIGYAEMVEANQDLPHRGRLEPGTEVLIPSQFILPKERTGLVINVAELRVYYFPAGESVVYTFPIAEGREGWSTPLGMTKVVRKVEGPIWIVPPSIMEESIRNKKPLKKVYLADDPQNPLGKYALYLGFPGIRLHGTNAPVSIGLRGSHGCMRLWPDDIQFLYEHVPVGTPVTIVNEENKVGWLDHSLYLEAEIPFPDRPSEISVQKEINDALVGHPNAVVDWDKVQDVLDEQVGVPVVIGHD